MRFSSVTALFVLIALAPVVGGTDNHALPPQIPTIHLGSVMLPSPALAHADTAQAAQQTKKTEVVLTPKKIAAVPRTIHAVETSVPEKKILGPTPKQTAQSVTPVRVVIPSIGLDSNVVPVGLNAAGEMEVPDGKSTNVGWYKQGTLPGNRGSAVFDAHVFAAFSKLKYANIGDEILVYGANGEQLRFVVRASTVYSLSELTSSMLFGKTDERRLNLITCAGSLTPDHSTYDHRLVVYATLE